MKLAFKNTVNPVALVASLMPPISRAYKLSLFLSLIIALTMLTTNSRAQTAQTNQDNRVIALPDLPPVNTQAEERQQQLVLSNVFKVLDQVGTIIPGRGFNSVGIGDSLARVVQVWGKPQLASRKGLAYQLDAKTVIQFLGKKKIKRINIQGLQGSLAHVNNGIKFGMNPTQVKEYFKFKARPDNNKRLRYKSLGIEFIFKNQQLFEIDVFSR